MYSIQRYGNQSNLWDEWEIKGGSVENRSTQVSQWRITFTMKYHIAILAPHAAGICHNRITCSRYLPQIAPHAAGSCHNRTIPCNGSAGATTAALFAREGRQSRQCRQSRERRESRGSR